MDTNFVNEIILLVIAAFIGGYTARSFKMPPVVGYLISGIIFGAVAKSFIPSFDELFELSRIGVSLLLFTLGFEVSLNYLSKINRKVLLAGFLQVCMTSLLLLPLIILFGYNFQASVLFSILFSFSSTAVILKLLEEKSMISNFPGTNVFVILLLQDLFIVPLLFAMPIIFNRGDFMVQNSAVFLTGIVKPMGLFILLYIANKFFLGKLFKLIFKFPSQELTVLATIFIAVISIALLNYSGLPESIAAFFAGVLLSEERKNLVPLSSIRPLRDVLLVLFFVLIGMLVDANYLVSRLPLILFFTGILMLFKFFILFFILRFLKFVPSANIFISSHVANIGEFSIIIGQIALAQRLIPKEYYEDLLSVFIVSLTLIPLIIRAVNLLYTKYKNTNFVKNFMGESHYFHNPKLESLKDHVVICGHGRVGREVRSILDMAEVPYIVLDYNKSVVDDLEHEMKNALFGDPTDLSTLKLTSIKDAKILVVAIADNTTQKLLIKNALKINPNILIICRSHIDEDKYELVNLGVNTIVVPEFEAGLRIGKKVLELLNFKDEKTYEFLKKLRKFHLVH